MGHLESYLRWAHKVLFGGTTKGSGRKWVEAHIVAGSTRGIFDILYKFGSEQRGETRNPDLLYAWTIFTFPLGALIVAPEVGT